MKSPYPRGKICLIAFACVQLTVRAQLLQARRENGSRRNFSLLEPKQINLNITVPFALRPRLYPYGDSVTDHQLPATGSLQGYVLQSEISFGSENYSFAYISKDGVVGFKPDFMQSGRNTLPGHSPLIAVFWTETTPDAESKVYFRETLDPQILSLAASEVQMQYGFDSSFIPTSVFTVTWERLASVRGAQGVDDSPRNTFQMALILSNNGSFAHLIYSNLSWNGEATAMFNPGNGQKALFLPWSGTRDVVQLSEYSNMGVPGEWMFKLDEADGVHSCGAGYKGMDCSMKCSKNEFFYDCSKRCHCQNGDPCNPVNGACADERCQAGWTNYPSCDEDIDECSTLPKACGGNSPDCVNTPGSFRCTCLVGYDEMTQTCRKVTTDYVKVQTTVDDGKDRDLQLANIKSNLVKVAQSGDVILVPQKTSEFVYNPYRPKPLQGTSYRNKPLTASVTPLLLNRLAFGTDLWSGNQQSVALKCTLNCDANAHCEFVNNLQNCICNRGYTGDGNNCYDVNECLLEGKCPKNSKCLNTDGSYECQCAAGFALKDNICTDVNECAEGKATCPGEASLCVNNNGSYECRCRAGFSGNPTDPSGCIDINECLLSHVSCGVNAECQNTIGSYECRCHAGYQANKDGSVGCEDLDECETHPCGQFANCQNTRGSYTCHCKQGYVGNGFHCEKSKLLTDHDSSANILLDSNNHWTTLETQMPVRFLQVDYRKIFVSVYGIVTFDTPVLNYKRPTQLGPAIMPFYRNLKMNEIEKVTIVHRSNGTLLSDLARLVRDVEGLKVYKATEVIVATFEQKKSGGNNFQIALFTFDATTYALFIYENVENVKATVGINGPTATNSLYLPTTEVNVTDLTKKSNIGIPGKWMWRVDDEFIMACSTGYQDPPFCQKDIDECELDENACDKNALCINTRGSYVCTCKAGYSGDGRQCFEVNPCYLESGAVCGQNAECFVPAFQRSKPECVCKEGFIGDGFLCMPVPDASSFTFENDRQSKSTSSKVDKMFEERPTIRPRSYRPIFMREHVQTAPPDDGVEQRWRERFELEHKVAIARHFNGKIMEPPQAEEDKTNQTTSTTETYTERPTKEISTKKENMTFKLLIIVVPAILILVWLFLLAILIRVCISRRNTRNRQKAEQHCCLTPYPKRTSPSLSSGYETYGSYFNTCVHPYSVTSVQAAQLRGQRVGCSKY